MKRLSPLTQLSLGLALLTCALLLLINLVFGVLPDRAAQSMQIRKNFAESMASQIAVLIEQGERRLIESTFAQAMQREAELRSLAIRRSDQVIVAQTGDHLQAWNEPRDQRSTLTHVQVPLNAGAERWGSLEMTFRAESRSLPRRVLAEPLWVTLLLVASVGALVYWLYVRRALQHLDPSAVIPQRVQSAFDVMTEGVVMLDMSGRIMLANRVFQSLAGLPTAKLIGKSLSRLPCIEASFAEEAHEHPWMRTIEGEQPVLGTSIDMAGSEVPAHKLVINCAPITDAEGTVRGCLATFNDVTALIASNDRLREAMVELATTREEMMQKNAELERLATRDALTGCWNRRAFLEQLEAAFADARQQQRGLACLMIDIDHFKRINDSFGHVTGDKVIQQVACALEAAVRPNDFVGRYGGEEFCVAIAALDLDDAAELADRVRAHVSAHCARSIPELPELHVTVSCGVAALGADHASVMQIVEAADEALYRAKQTGRDRVCVASAQTVRRSVVRIAPSQSEALAVVE